MNDEQLLGALVLLTSLTEISSQVFLNGINDVSIERLDPGEQRVVVGNVPGGVIVAEGGVNPGDDVSLELVSTPGVATQIASAATQGNLVPGAPGTGVSLSSQINTPTNQQLPIAGTNLAVVLQQDSILDDVSVEIVQQAPTVQGANLQATQAQANFQATQAQVAQAGVAQQNTQTANLAQQLSNPVNDGQLQTRQSAEVGGVSVEIIQPVTINQAGLAVPSGPQQVVPERQDVSIEDIAERNLALLTPQQRQQMIADELARLDRLPLIPMAFRSLGVRERDDISLEDQIALLSPADRLNPAVIDQLIRADNQRELLEDLASAERDNLSRELELARNARLATRLSSDPTLLARLQAGGWVDSHENNSPEWRISHFDAQNQPVYVRHHSGELFDDVSLEWRHLQGQQMNPASGLPGAGLPSNVALHFDRSNERDDLSLEWRDRSNTRLDLASLQRMLNQQQAVPGVSARTGRQQELTGQTRPAESRPSAGRSRILNPIVGNLRSSNRLIQGQENNPLALTTSGGNSGPTGSIVVSLLVAYILKTIV